MRVLYTVHGPQLIQRAHTDDLFVTVSERHLFYFSPKTGHLLHVRDLMEMHT